MSAKARQVDVVIVNHGSICLLRPNNKASRGWIDQKVCWEQSWGDAIVVEPRYVPDIVLGLVRDGFKVEVR